MGQNGHNIVQAGSEAIQSAQDFSREQLQTLKNTIAASASDAEFAYFIEVCKHKRLDPFSRQIHFVPRRQKVNGNWITKWEAQTGIDGFRAIAQRTGQLDGQDGPYWCGADGQWRDVWLSDEPPAAAKVIVFRRDARKPFTGIAKHGEYVQTTRDGNPNTMWSKMPANQLAKCAESLALRKAFPEELSGVYESGEIAPREEPATVIEAPQHDPDAPFGFGQYKTTRIRDMDAETLVKIVDKARTQDARQLAQAEIVRRRQEEDAMEVAAEESDDLFGDGDEADTGGAA